MSYAHDMEYHAARMAALGEGLSKRELFAAMALQGLLACPHQMCGDIENQAGLAVEYADKLLDALTDDKEVQP